MKLLIMIITVCFTFCSLGEEGRAGNGGDGIIVGDELFLLDLVEAGPFGGQMVVSMRPIRPEDVARVQSMCTEFPLAHGAPVHVGDPTDIGIKDINTPEWGDAVGIHDGEVCVFWGCGVTPQNAAIRAKLPIFVSHKPGAMLITDVDERANPPVL